MGVVELGLAPDEAGLLTFKELYVLNRRNRKKEKRSTYRMGMVCAAIYNSVRRKRSDKVWQPKDFVGKERKIQTPERMESVVRMMHHFLVGKRKRDE